MCCLIEREKRGGGRKKNDGEIRTRAPRVVELHHYHLTTMGGILNTVVRGQGLFLSVYVVFFDKIDSNR